VVAVIGVGNSLRHDDGAGLEVVRRLRDRAQAGGIAVHEHEGEPLALLEVWEGADGVLLVDAIRGGGEPGSFLCLDVSAAPVPERLRGSTSTHAIGLGEAIELGRALGRLPERLLLFGVEGSRFDAGRGLSEEVGAAVEMLAEEVLVVARRWPLRWTAG
jgi:hydrogenase maturation protease